MSKNVILNKKIKTNNNNGVKMNKTIYYEKYTDNIVESKNQNYKIKEDYQWIHTNLIYRIISQIIYFIACIFSVIYSKIVLKIKIENKDILKKYKKEGYFVYGNHTQTIGDVFVPRQIVGKRFYTIASQSNLGIPVIGKILPMLGALVIPDNISQTKKFMKAVEKRIEQKNAIIIYPEAHVWPYYTKIRPFPSTSFKFPIETNSPTFCFTTTYYKRKNKEKPGIKIYVDGPFFPDMSIKPKEREKKLCNNIYNKMLERSKHSNYEYIIYKRGKK